MVVALSTCVLIVVKSTVLAHPGGSETPCRRDGKKTNNKTEEAKGYTTNRTALHDNNGESLSTHSAVRV